MLLEDLIITDTSKENVFELQENYPCCSRDMVITAGNSRVVPWHWHEELEILYVREGEIDYWTAGNCIRLRKSDGIFINTNVMHQVIFPQEMEDARSQVFMFRPEFLAEEGSLLHKKYICPVLYDHKFQAAVLRRESEMQRKVLEDMLEMDRIQDKKAFGYEMAFRNKIAEMWIDFIHMLGVEPETAKLRTSEKEERLKEMLAFIHKEYRNEISLSDIADAAKVSKRDALRCFQEEIHISPGAYLKDYRLQMACTMLRNTSETITTVSQNCGFHSASYFGKVFRSQMGCTPYEFKNKIGTGNREGISEKN